MTQYIDKAALVAEIERLKDELKASDSAAYKEAYIVGAEHTIKTISDVIDTLEVKYLQEEPVSEDLEKEFSRFLDEKEGMPRMWRSEEQQEWALDIARHFAEWQKQQMEKNRLKHCSGITEEQYNLETGFLDSHIKNNNRIPTFLDAIEYGMDLQKQEMMKEAVGAEINYWNHGGLSLLTDINLNKVAKEGDKVKLIIIKEK